MIEQLISRVFHTRNVAHFNHWQTQSFSQHSALGSFYDCVIDDLDDIVEAYQGAFDLVGSIPMPPESPSDFLKHLIDESEWIADNRSKIAKNNSAIENLIDTMSDRYLSTIYKLRNLK